MRKTVAALLVTGALLAAPPPASAEGVTVDMANDVCTLVAATDPSFPSVRMGYVMGVRTEGDGRLTCSVQIGYSTHAGPDVASAGASGTDVIVLRPTAISYAAPPDVPIYLCAAFAPWASPPQYWDPTGFWSASENTPCTLVSSVGTNDPLFDIVGDLVVAVSEIADGVKRSLDPTVCPVLALLHSVFPDPTAPVYVSAAGDVYAVGTRVWNCPPY